MSNIVKAITKIKSGIEGFDPLIYGGFPTERSYLVSGEPGTGKTIFSLQFLLEGLRQGENAIYRSIDEKPEHVINDALSLNWDLTKYLNNNQLKIIDISSFFSSNKDTEGKTIDINRIIEKILEYTQQSKPSRLVIDPIAPLILKDTAIPDVIQYIRSTVFAIESIPNCTSLLTSYIPVGTNKVSAFGIEEFATSGIIQLKLISQNNKRIRTIGVRKMRGTRIDLSEYSFDIMPDRGIILRQALWVNLKY